MPAAERFHAAVRNEVITTEAGSVAVTVSIGGVSLPRHGDDDQRGDGARAGEPAPRAARAGNGHFVAYAPSPARQEERRGNAALSSELVAALKKSA